MDKEKLLSYFEAHYLSKREVLFRLPLNLPIDAFWQELQNRRKARATVLPLYNASGRPYWFAVTDTMVSASEKLCEAALEQDDSFDPYRVQMTGTIMQECFFTSFVEGAQIPVQEAMDFLQRGTEPENIQEQMLWNNRNAWVSVMNALYRPIDEGMLKSLAFMLTEDMEGCSEEYRQSDQHPIAAMNNEPYSLPSSYILPERMNDYCKYLQSPDVHPLIKAAVGQAYILVSRPFQEGNERMSRMISYIVLMRSGYEFFRDISISGMIARESYRYYKSMCEILREENDGDLTYFIEYFLDMLSRALDTKRQADLRREQESIEAERNMATQPLRPPTPPTSVEEPTIVEMDEPTENDEPDIDEISNDSAPETADSPPGCAEFWKVVDSLERSFSTKEQNVARVIRLMLKAGKTSFTLNDWRSMAKYSKTAAQNARDCMLAKGLIDNVGSHHEGLFRFALDGIIRPQKKDRTAKSAVTAATPSSELIELLTSLEEHTDSARDMRIGKYIRQLVDAGITVTSAQDWVAANPVSKNVYAEDFRRAASLGILKKVIDKAPNILHYEINMVPRKSERFDNMTDMQRNCLAMLYERFHQHPFTVDEGAKCIQKPVSTSAYHFSNLMSMGALKCKKEPGRLVLYNVAVTPDEHPECFSESENKNVAAKMTRPTGSSSVGSIASA